MAEVRTDDRVQVAGPSAAMPVAVLDVALEVSQDVAATRSDEARPGSVDVVVANFVDGAADGERAEKANSDDEEVTMVGGVPAAATASAVPPAVSDAIESDSSVEEEDAGVPAADTDDESGAGEAMTVSTESTGADVEQTVKRLVADDMAPAEIDSGSPAGDGTAWSSEGAETVEPVASQLSSSIVDKVSEVEAAASITEDPSANAVSVVQPGDHRSMRNRSIRSSPLLLSRSLAILELQENASCDRASNSRKHSGETPISMSRDSTALCCFSCRLVGRWS